MNIYFFLQDVLCNMKKSCQAKDLTWELRCPIGHICKLSSTSELGFVGSSELIEADERVLVKSQRAWKELSVYVCRAARRMFEDAFNETRPL